MIDERPLRELAAVQHGLVTVEQTLAMGMDDLTRKRLVDGHRWNRLTPRVLGLVGCPATRAQRALLAVLDSGPGAALHSTSAAAWWGIPGNLLEPLQVVSARGHVNRMRRDAARHEPTLLPPHHIITLEGVPTVVPARALFEVAGTRRRGAEQPGWVDRMARMVDNAWSMRLVSGRTLHAMLDDLAQRGRPGIRVMRQVLAERTESYTPPASGVEARLAQIMRSAGLPAMRRQVDSGGASWIGRVDFRAEAIPLIVEVQSERFHASLVDSQMDARRIERLVQAGFTVVEVTDVEVWHRPDVATARIWEAVRTIGRAA